MSGSALLVRVDRADSFFPEIYNEDWLFLAPHLEKRAVAAVGSVAQLKYEPFEIPGRAGVQEFGDVLAEGLIGHLHRGPPAGPPTAGYWEDFLLRRQAFIAEAMTACASRAPEDPRARAALLSLRRAESARAQITASQLVRYVSAWTEDLRRWREFLHTVPALGTLEAAFSWLGLQARWSPTVRPVQE